MAGVSSIRRKFVGAVTRAFGEFLGLPIVIVVCFVAFAIGIYLVDRAIWSDEQQSANLHWLAELFGDTAAINSLLTTIATSIITVTSITFSLLLLAVQQGASALTSQVFDQFLRRRSNQFHFGFFVGLSVYCLLTLVTVSTLHRPIFATLAALLFTSVALCMIVVLIYNTIDQMRPAEIVKAIHHHILLARRSQLALLQATRRKTRGGLAFEIPLASPETGIVAAIDVAAVRATFLERGEAAVVEVEFLVGIGTYAAYRDVLIRLRSDREFDEPFRKRLSDAAISAIKFSDGRDLGCDPAFGVEQLAAIGWTSVSTARSNPQPGILVVRSLRDILARWGEEGPSPSDPQSPVIYPDHVMAEAIGVLESLAVVSSESMQHQTLAEIMRTLAVLLDTLPEEFAECLENVALRSVSALGEHVLTGDLEASLQQLEMALSRHGRATASNSIMRATAALRQSVGRLNSRSTRVPQPGLTVGG